MIGSRRVIANLAFIDEQSGNGGARHQTLAIRQKRKSSASVSAAQTIALGELARATAGSVAGCAAAAAAGIARMILRHLLQIQKRPRTGRGLLRFDRSYCLLQRAVDRVELGVQVAAEAVNGGDNGKRNASRNEAVFDGGGAGLVLHETRNQILHR
jgi:hypothetical protein